MQSIRVAALAGCRVPTLPRSARAGECRRHHRRMGELRPARRGVRNRCQRTPRLMSLKALSQDDPDHSSLPVGSSFRRSFCRYLHVGNQSESGSLSEGERINSYVDAFRRWFPVRLRGKDAIGKISLVGTKEVNGHAGRNYNFVIGELSGSLQVFATRKRFYAVVFLTKKKDLVTKERFPKFVRIA